MNKGRKIDRLIELGWRNVDIAAHLNCNEKMVSNIRSAGSYEKYLASRRQRYAEHSKRIGTYGQRSTGKRTYSYDSDAIIRAVDAGKSYGQVAKQFGIKSRNVVAGIMNRRPEARGVNT